MFKKIFFLLSHVLLFLDLSGQSDSNKIRLHFSIEERITPIVFSYRNIGQLGNNKVYYSPHQQVTGPSMGIGFRFPIANSRFHFTSGWTFKYDHIYFEKIQAEVLNSINGLIHDFSMGIEYHIPIKSVQLIPSFAFGFMNRGTTYAFSYPVSGGVVTEETSFYYNALVPGIAMKKGDLAYFINMIIPNYHQFVNFAWDKFMIPAIGIRYEFNKPK
jgi:hypothetical protein